MIGNFIADAVKGNKYLDYDTEISKGIMLHRHIDTFSDEHPIVEHSKARLRNKYKKYAGVIVDVFYDHFLAANWKNYAASDLKDFTMDTYNTLYKHENILPEKIMHMLYYMKKENWLYEYRKVEGIHEALSGLSRRTKFDSNMDMASFDLRADYALFQKEFEAFFPELERFSRERLAQI